jgi:sensor c-di-GMP phosphodiesterase-like protein
MFGRNLSGPPGPIDGQRRYEGRPLISSKLRKTAAVLIGLALAGVPAAAVHSWLGRHFEHQAARDLDVTARRVIGLAEARLVMVIEALDDLMLRGVRSCAGADRDAMHETSFRIVPIKEISIIGPGGETRCTNLAISLGARTVAGQIEDSRPDVTIDVIRVGSLNDGFVRIRRAAADGLALAALMPVDIMLPRTSSDGGPHVIRAVLTALDGAVLGARLAEGGEPDTPGELLTAQVRSQSFGMMVTTSVPRARVLASYRDTMALAAAGAGGGSALIFALIAFGARRSGDDPRAELEQAIRNGELVPYYQPIVDLTTARVVSAEVLVRWRKPNGTLVPPVQFIPLAESSGLIVELTRSLMRRVCAEAGAAIGARPNFRIGFNLSAQHFVDERVVEDVRTIFSASPIALNQVLLEVTERQALDNLAMARRVIAALQELGVHVGIDDLGTGHSGLSYMLKLGVDFIKIDKMFVDALDTERYSATIIETLVGLARDMRMDIIAEGVETFEQVQSLRDRGIRKAQGYAFAPPLPGSSFLQLLAAAGPDQGIEIQRNPLADAAAGQRVLVA